jgi:peptidase E
MNLHLFSNGNIEAIVEASRPYLSGKSDARVAYLPLASLLPEKWLDFTTKAFNGLARIAMVNTESMSAAEIEAILRRVHLVFIPGGNTFLLNHRLYLSRLVPFLRRKILAGLPVVAASAGTVLCGPNILTSRDMNSVETSCFTGLNLLPFNLSVHYPDDELGRAYADDWLADYHVFHDNPVILMSDGASVKVEKNGTKLVGGDAWVLRAGQEKEKLLPGRTIKPAGGP